MVDDIETFVVEPGIEGGIDEAVVWLRNRGYRAVGSINGVVFKRRGVTYTGEPTPVQIAEVGDVLHYEDGRVIVG